jgi:hypothetical protein
MMKKLLLGLPVFAIVLAFEGIPRAPFVQKEELAKLMPRSSLAYAEGPRVGELLASGLDHPFLAAVLDSDLAHAVLAQAPMTPEAAIAMADLYLGRPVLGTVSRLCSRGVAISVGLKRGKPVYALALRGEDEKLLRETLDGLLVKLAKQYGVEEEKMRGPHDRIRGVDVWYLGEELALGVSGSLLLASNDEGRLRDMLDLGAAAEDDDESLASDESFERARATRKADALAWAWMDVDAIQEATPHGGDKLREMASNPAVHFLLGPAIAGLGTAGEMEVEIGLGDERLELSLTGTDLADDAAQKRVLYPAGAEVPPLPNATATDGGAAILYRDFAGLFHERTELFPAEILPKFSEAISNFSYVFGGADMTDEILPALSPWLGLVVRDAQFRAGALPEVKLPGAAVIARVSDPEKIGERLVAGFQSLIGFVNIDGAQKARQPMLLDIELCDGVKISSAHFVAPPEGQGIDMRYNLEPACAMVGDAFVIGTHVSLVRSIVGQLKRGEVRGGAPGREELSLSGPMVARVVHDNSEALVMNSVLNEGKTMEVARGEVGGLEKLAAMIEGLDVTTERAENGDLHVSAAIVLGKRESR